MTTITDKELIKEIKERIGSLDVRDNIERRAYEIALASLEAEPIAWECGENIILFNPCLISPSPSPRDLSPPRLPPSSRKKKQSTYNTAQPD
ncbi:valyl-tRNA synthetase [Escherichia coli]|uniref:valyl-tRNA synthetase n=1 Tax=Escherichia coli TaxID=562 RepID=UPI003D9A7FAE